MSTDMEDLFVLISLWSYNQEKTIYLQPKNIFNVLFLLSGDIELFLGPQSLFEINNITRFKASTSEY